VLFDAYIETARIAFSDTGIPIFKDWRLRECNYGDLNGARAEIMRRGRIHYLDKPYPNGESWRQAINRVGRFLPDLRFFYEGGSVLVIGHVATRWAFDHLLKGIEIEQLIAEDFAWQEGWEYVLP
jgi:2,3-bisphosphoglycerate-dependent phosphoglycerate mutase